LLRQVLHSKQENTRFLRKFSKAGLFNKSIFFSHKRQCAVAVHGGREIWLVPWRACLSRLACAAGGGICQICPPWRTFFATFFVRPKKGEEKTLGEQRKKEKITE